MTGFLTREAGWLARGGKNAVVNQSLNTKKGETVANLFAAESDQMTTTAGDVDGVNAEVQGELGRIRGVVDGLAGEWKGQAKDSFDDLMLRWDDAAMRLSNALTDIADNIRANSSSFDAGEDEGASSFKQVAAAGASLLNL